MYYFQVKQCEEYENDNFNILFIMQRACAKKSGLASIYARISVGGMR